MNARLQELYNTVAGDDKLCFDSYLAEKFAQLIIADAIEIVEPDSYHQAYPDNVLGSYGGLELLYHKVAKIKRHFDV